MADDLGHRQVFEIETAKTGLMIAVRPDSHMLEKFQSGKPARFLIGVLRIEDDETADTG